MKFFTTMYCIVIKKLYIFVLTISCYNIDVKSITNMIKLLITITILLCYPCIAIVDRISGYTSMDSDNNRETVNVIISESPVDSIGVKNDKAPENGQKADTTDQSCNHPENGEYWFIGINVYPDKLKNY
jgi:hypothetical protein